MSQLNGSEKYALENLAGQPGWQLYCQRVQQIVAMEIDAKVFDESTTDEERRALVKARNLFIKQYSPERIRESLVALARSAQIQAEARRA